MLVSLVSGLRSDEPPPISAEPTPLLVPRLLELLCPIPLN